MCYTKYEMYSVSIHFHCMGKKHPPFVFNERNSGFEQHECKQITEFASLSELPFYEITEYQLTCWFLDVALTRD